MGIRLNELNIAGISGTHGTAGGPHIVLSKEEEERKREREHESLLSLTYSVPSFSFFFHHSCLPATVAARESSSRAVQTTSDLDISLLGVGDKVSGLDKARVHLLGAGDQRRRGAEGDGTILVIGDRAGIGGRRKHQAESRLVQHDHGGLATRRGLGRAGCGWRRGLSMGNSGRDMGRDLSRDD